MLSRSQKGVQTNLEATVRESKQQTGLHRGKQEHQAETVTWNWPKARAKKCWGPAVGSEKGKGRD